ncbi:OmpA-like transmembrane domain protein [Piscirickettsia salmonis]|uniref:Outer membrane beta-barrel domain protein n=1 Tax=Piscirickettsia salmonis TaxID=1238 RepID=A0A1L6TCH0_PISSA|nr:outer membrane beta-barrel protein [Piscirickettsia salmonis]AKP74113.1 hypothetical protein PSLF89_2434 [Piscirickettsia salmonis LF-89 = ATCC VR-1361]ALB22987.1 outer membrane beta-barrel domain protein [Piscirickettsia salmonis]ALY02934.1 hypothetical protein AWE47_08830 [Piscirickettsia salmonis]AMA42490.1 hypothetical protein AWJ11_09040 [Piscirickettsia salmonis]AOS34960.1 hypothetical protein AVM72_06180 [Piscirickettsia salmonis]
MKAIIKLTAITALLISASTLATKPGAYIGLNLGYGGMDTPNLDLTKINNIANDSHSTRGLAGSINAGYLWNKGALNYGFELGYSTYANNQYTAVSVGKKYNFTYSGSSLDLLGVVQYNINPNWNIFGKAGLSYVSQKTTGDGILSLAADSKSKMRPKFALGAGYGFDNGIGLNVMASHTFGTKPQVSNNIISIKDDVNKVAPIDMITVGITYNF